VDRLRNMSGLKDTVEQVINRLVGIVGICQGAHPITLHRDTTISRKHRKRTWTRCAVCDTTLRRGSGRTRRLRKGSAGEGRDE